MSVFKKYAAIYDLIYKDKDYSKEAQHIVEILQKYGVNQGSSILNLGCGTGRHDHILAKMGCKMTGVDMSEEMVDIANHPLVKGGRGDYNLVKAGFENINPLNPLSQGDLESSPLSKGTGGIKKVGGIKGATGDCHFLQGDIRNIILEESFDAVISMFHVMSYQNSDEDVIAVFNNVYRHLNKNGIFVFDCWYADAVLTEKPEKRVKVVENDELLVTRYAKPEMHEDTHVVDVNYKIQVTEKTTGITETFHETHNMRYFSVNEIKQFAESAGFEMISHEIKGWNLEVVAGKV